jgi:hypothetical protein
VLPACGAPSADSPQAITTWRTIVSEQVQQLGPPLDDLHTYLPRY